MEQVSSIQAAAKYWPDAWDKIKASADAKGRKVSNDEKKFAAMGFAYGFDVAFRWSQQVIRDAVDQAQAQEIFTGSYPSESTAARKMGLMVGTNTTNTNNTNNTNK